jgi:hypothetical protein
VNYSETPNSSPRAYCEHCGEELWGHDERNGECLTCQRRFGSPDIGGLADDNYITSNQDPDDHTG